MRIYLSTVFLIAAFLFSGTAFAQVHPAEGAELNYRLIGFSFPDAVPAGYKLEIAKGKINKEDSFSRNIVSTTDIKSNKVIAEVPAFGSWYTWRFYPTAKGAKGSKFYHFRTGYVSGVDTSKRLRITKDPDAYASAYVFVDGHCILYDMKGQPVWYLPGVDGTKSEDMRVRDLKSTSQGTITFLLGNQIYEIDYNGRVLWKGPNNGKVSGDSSEGFHHEFTRLSNGHYMVLGKDLVDVTSSAGQMVSPGGAVGDMPGGGQSITRKKIFGSIIEYDEQGNVVWSWKTSKYFKESDLRYWRANMPGMDFHENSFFFDEKTNMIYLSLKNVSRILKIHYPDGKVVSSYGETFAQGVAEKKNELFCQQHSCRISQQGYLYLFNNNLCDSAACSTVIMMEEPRSPKGELKKVWEYGCKETGEQMHKLAAGGNAIDLPDQSMFINMDRIFIVNREKQVLWSAVPEDWNKEQALWEVVHEYRASIITERKDLERIIWNSK